jgi:prepilin-type processing-associated H-X9-DG protein
MRVSQQKAKAALTAVEIIVVIAVIALLALVFLPGLAKAKGRSSRIGCPNNLKQIALSFKTWALDNNDHYPAQVSMTNGGAMELMAKPSVFPLFQVMSNELSTPKVLLCPLDKERSATANFANVLADTNLSYFLALDVNQENPSMWLAGDRNFTNCKTPPTALLAVSSNSILGWDKRMHNKCGNICFADGSVSGFDNLSLRRAIQTVGQSTNRLIVP